jgi:hypothetical protein
MMQTSSKKQFRPLSQTNHFCGIMIQSIFVEPPGIASIPSEPFEHVIKFSSTLRLGLGCLSGSEVRRRV